MLLYSDDQTVQNLTEHKHVLGRISIKEHKVRRGHIRKVSKQKREEDRNRRGIEIVSNTI